MIGAPGTELAYVMCMSCPVDKEEHNSFITTYQAIAGWKAQLMVWNEEDEELGGFYEPFTTSYFAWKTEEEAIKYAKEWAEAEELEYKPRVKEV